CLPAPAPQLLWTDRGEIVLYWQAPASAWNSVRLVRNRDRIPTSPDDGEVLYQGTDDHFVDTTAQAYTRYYYALWTEYAGRYSAQAATADVTGRWNLLEFTQSDTFTSSATLPFMTVHAWGAGGGGSRRAAGDGGVGGGGGYS